MDESLERVIVEWVLTNGTLEGFDTRVRDTLPQWDTVGPEGMTVYRAQGGFIEAPSGAPAPSSLVLGLRPVLATSKDPTAIVRYADKSKNCCIFKIHLAPGTRILDVNRALTFLDGNNQSTAAIKTSILREIRNECPSTGAFPTNTTPLRVMESVIVDRCIGRMKRRTGEYIPPEQEVMVDGKNGTLTQPVPIDPISEMQAFEVTYMPNERGGSRGRTFRSKTMRRNKNGRRLTHQSKARRNRRR